MLGVIDLGNLALVGTRSREEIRGILRRQPRDARNEQLDVLRSLWNGLEFAAHLDLGSHNISLDGSVSVTHFEYDIILAQISFFIGNRMISNLLYLLNLLGPHLDPIEDPGQNDGRTRYECNI